MPLENKYINVSLNNNGHYHENRELSWRGCGRQETYILLDHHANLSWDAVNTGTFHFNLVGSI